MSELVTLVIASVVTMWNPSIVRVIVRWDVPPVEEVEPGAAWVLPVVGVFAVVLAVVVAVAVVLIRRSGR